MARDRGYVHPCRYDTSEVPTVVLAPLTSSDDSDQRSIDAFRPVDHLRRSIDGTAPYIERRTLGRRRFLLHRPCYPSRSPCYPGQPSRNPLKITAASLSCCRFLGHDPRFRFKVGTRRASRFTSTAASAAGAPFDARVTNNRGTCDEVPDADRTWNEAALPSTSPASPCASNVCRSFRRWRTGCAAVRG